MESTRVGIHNDMVSAYRQAWKETSFTGSLKWKTSQRVMADSQGIARALRNAGFGERIQTGTGRNSYNVWFPTVVMRRAEEILRGGEVSHG